MKRQFHALSFLLAVLLAVCLAACGEAEVPRTEAGSGPVEAVPEGFVPLASWLAAEGLYAEEWETQISICDGTFCLFQTSLDDTAFLAERQGQYYANEAILRTISDAAAMFRQDQTRTFSMGEPVGIRQDGTGYSLTVCVSEMTRTPEPDSGWTVFVFTLLSEPRQSAAILPQRCVRVETDTGVSYEDFEAVDETHVSIRIPAAETPILLVLNGGDSDQDARCVALVQEEAG